MKNHKKDNRISILQLPHKGVSHARNAGIKKSKSQYIAFLDSDNTWDPEYLSLMISFIEKFCLDSGYCAAHLIGDDIDQWLGDHFSWQACVVQNYIDLNCFMIKSTNNELIELIKKRSIVYSKALYKIDCDKLTKNEITNKILDIYEAY